MAIEIQWSGQTSDETERRQARYASAGVRGLWLMRRLAAPISEHVPAARVSEAGAGDFLVHLPAMSGEHSFSIKEFLSAAFTGRLKFGLPDGARALLSIQAGTMPCWKCGAFTRVITDMSVKIGPHEFTFHVADIEDDLDLFQPVFDDLRSEAEIGSIKHRHSKTLGGKYLSNGCAHCDALIGQFFEHEALEDRETVLTTQFALNEGWRAFLETQDGDLAGWGVFEFD